MLTAYTARVLTDEEVQQRLESIRERLKDARRAVGFSQKKLEKESGVDQPTISRIEDATMPDLSTLVRLADGLGLTLSAFVANIEGGTIQGLKRTLELDHNRPSPQQTLERAVDDRSISSSATAQPVEDFRANVLARLAKLEAQRESDRGQTAKRHAARPRSRKRRA